MKSKLVLLIAAALAGCCALSACGGQEKTVPANQTQASAAAPETAAGETAGGETTEDTSFFQAPDEPLLTFLSAVSAVHEGYKTRFTPEGGEEYVGANAFGDYPSAFSENGHAMVLRACDAGMSQTQYQVCVTTDYGETWKVYKEELNTVGSVSGLITDGEDYWAHGFATALDDSFMVALSAQMTHIPDKVCLKDYAKTVEAGTDSTTIRSVRFDPEAGFLKVEIEAKAFDSETAAYRSLGGILLELNPDLTLHLVEKQETA